jgi:hypothetical protein
LNKRADVRGRRAGAVTAPAAPGPIRTTPPIMHGAASALSARSSRERPCAVSAIWNAAAGRRSPPAWVPIAHVDNVVAHHGCAETGYLLRATTANTEHAMFIRRHTQSS